MKVWVIMGNDYPKHVFDNKLAADLYCKLQTRINAYDMERGESRKIYWRAYEFPLLKEGPVE